MMRMTTKKKTKEMPVVNGKSGGSGVGVGSNKVLDWELRPGGMLVQKRNSDSDRSSSSSVSPTIRVKVKYGSSYHEIYINSQASFGELKKLLAAPTGLHHEDQKVLFKDKERDSNVYLDIVGVKEGSKMVLVEDPISREKRYLEMRKTAKLEKASKSISEISLEVDKLAAQVSSLESVISKGGKVAETAVLNLIELLMNQLIKLDGIIAADGDVKLQRRMQVKRVQKYVETLDLLKIRNSMPPSNGNISNGGQLQMQQQQQQQKHSIRQVAEEQMPSSNSNVGLMQMAVPKAIQQQPQRHSTGQISSLQKQSQQPARHSASGTVVTTQWETFDFDLPASSTSPAGTTNFAQSQNQSPPSKFTWDFFHY